MTRKRQNGRRYVLSAVAITFACAVSVAPTRAVNVAVIDTTGFTPPPGAGWCSFLADEGHTCSLFPATGPDASLDPFDVVIDLSAEWTDPDGLLQDVLRSGKGVITWALAPKALGVDSDPTVRAWIGASESTTGDGVILTVATDPILGSLTIGSDIGGGGFPAYAALRDTVGHPNAKILAEFETGTIGLMRNTWEGGRSVYMAEGLFDRIVILNAIAELGPQIPAVSTWGVIVMLLLVLSLGTILFRRLYPPCPRSE